MLKIFVTGDNHIGLKYANHHQAQALVSSRMEAFDTMVETANDEECDLFVITGDLFENTYSTAKRTVASLLDKLSRFRGTVVILPGNHDYYDAETKLWQYFEESMDKYDNLLLLRQYRPYALNIKEEKVTLYPAHCTTLHSAPGQNNLGWIKELDIDNADGFHIGIAHGAVEGETIDREGTYFLMKHAELESIPVDAWLIGHTHVPFPRNLTEDFAASGKIFNAGTHVQTDVSCNTEGQCFVIEISGDKTVRAKKVNSGTLRFYRKNIALEAGRMEDILEKELTEIADYSVVDLILSGAVTAEEYENRRAIIEDALSRFLEGTCKDGELSKLITEELIDAEFSETSFSAGLLKSLMDEPKEAQLVYELLKELKGAK